MSDVVKSALVKALRTFVQTFLFTLAASSAGVVDLSTAKAAVLGAGAAAFAAVWRGFDTLPVPTLVDRNGLAAVPGPPS